MGANWIHEDCGLRRGRITCIDGSNAFTILACVRFQSSYSLEVELFVTLRCIESPILFLVSSPSSPATGTMRQKSCYR